MAATLQAADPDFSAAAGLAGGSFLMTAAEYNLDEIKTHRVLHVVSAVQAASQHQQHHQPPAAQAQAASSILAQPSSPARAQQLQQQGALGGGDGQGGGAERGAEGSRSGRFGLPHSVSIGGAGPSAGNSAIGAGSCNGAGGFGGDDPASGGFSAAALATTAANALAELGSRGAGALAALKQPLAGTFVLRGSTTSSGYGAAAAAAGALSLESGGFSSSADADGSTATSQLHSRHGGHSGAGAAPSGARRIPGSGGLIVGGAAATQAPAPAAALLNNFARKVFVTVYADGPTRVLCFSDEPFAGGAAEEGGLQATGYRLEQVARQLRQVGKQLSLVMGPTAVPRAAMARAPPLVPSSPQHSPRVGAAVIVAALGGGGGLSLPERAGGQLLALPVPPGGAAAGDAGTVSSVPGAAPPGSGGGGTQRLQLDKLLSLLESGLPLGGDVKVRLLAAKGLAGGVDRHTNPYARLTVGPTSVTSPPVFNSSGPSWDHEETFEEVPATLDLVVEVWSLPHSGAQALLAASAAELQAASTFLGCVTVGGGRGHIGLCVEDSLLEVAARSQHHPPNHLIIRVIHRCHSCTRCPAPAAPTPAPAARRPTAWPPPRPSRPPRPPRRAAAAASRDGTCSRAAPATSASAGRSSSLSSGPSRWTAC